MKRIIKFLKTDIKIINSYFLFTIILIILVCIGYSSYALFSFTKTSTNVIEATVRELKKSGADTLIKLTDNKDNSGLYTITHAASSTLQIGATEDIIEYRYRGASPKNYVIFNNEVWRIIGIFPTDDGSGNIENRIKLIRNESIGTYKWNSTYSNNWTEATLNAYLNGDYYNTLTSETQRMIKDTKYYLGGNIDEDATSKVMYRYERTTLEGGTHYYKKNPISWTGKIGIMYISDYGYASSNCETKKLAGKPSEDLRACSDTNWLYKIKQEEWVISQCTRNGNSVFYIMVVGVIGSAYTYSNSMATRPVLYLTSAVKINGGDGTSTNPYTLGI